MKKIILHVILLFIFALPIILIILFPYPSDIPEWLWNFESYFGKCYIPLYSLLVLSKYRKPDIPTYIGMSFLLTVFLEIIYFLWPILIVAFGIFFLMDGFPEM